MSKIEGALSAGMMVASLSFFSMGVAKGLAAHQDNDLNVAASSTSSLRELANNTKPMDRISASDGGGFDVGMGMGFACAAYAVAYIEQGTDKK